ncbi:MAG: hypothetical protein WC683_01625 [bacterium]
MTDQDQKGEQGAPEAPIVPTKEKLAAVQQDWDRSDIRPTVLTVELPCGYLDREGSVHSELVVGEMTGYEEDLLTAKGPVLQRLNQIILNCTHRLGNIDDRAALNAAVAALTASDRMVALLAIRRVSLGDQYEVKVQCPSPECRDEVRYTLDLAQVEIRPMQDRTQRVWEHTLSSGRVVRWHVMTAADEEWLSAKGKRKEDTLTLGLLTRVEAIDGVPVERDRKHKEAMACLKGLPTRDRNEIRALFEQYEGHVDTVVDFACPSCQHEWRDDLNLGQPSFFFPSAP